MFSIEAQRTSLDRALPQVHLDPGGAATSGGLSIARARYCLGAVAAGINQNGARIARAEKGQKIGTGTNANVAVTRNFLVISFGW
jgi:hypothetical protein